MRFWQFRKWCCFGLWQWLLSIGYAVRNGSEFKDVGVLICETGDSPMMNVPIETHIPAEDMDCYRVSPLVNNAKNDTPECLKPA